MGQGCSITPPVLYNKAYYRRYESILKHPKRVLFSPFPSSSCTLDLSDAVVVILVLRGEHGGFNKADK